MSSHNASSLARSQQWKNELQKKPSDPVPIPPAQQMFKKPEQQKYLTPIMAPATICCEQANCDRDRIEHMPERFFREPAAPFTMVNLDSHDQSGPKIPSAPPAEYMDEICSYCGMNKGQLVTICCTGRDCDNSTKIDDIPMAAPPEEKRPKNTCNQFKF